MPDEHMENIPEFTEGSPTEYDHLKAQAVTGLRGSHVYNSPILPSETTAVTRLTAWRTTGAMSKPFSELRARMSPDAQQRAAERTKVMGDAMIPANSSTLRARLQKNADVMRYLAGPQSELSALLREAEAHLRRYEEALNKIASDDSDYVQTRIAREALSDAD